MKDPFFLRAMASNYMKENPDDFIPFMEDETGTFSQELMDFFDIQGLKTRNTDDQNNVCGFSHLYVQSCDNRGL